MVPNESVSIASRGRRFGRTSFEEEQFAAVLIPRANRQLEGAFEVIRIVGPITMRIQVRQYGDVYRLDFGSDQP
jgi:hypothetical protein